jgi:hypothetical protein
MTTLDFTPIWGLNYPDDFNLESVSLESAPTLNPIVMLADLMKVDITEPPACYANMPSLVHTSHALMLFHKLADDPAFDGIDPISLFAACIDTVLVWSFG